MNDIRFLTTEEEILSLAAQMRANSGPVSTATLKNSFPVIWKDKPYILCLTSDSKDQYHLSISRVNGLTPAKAEDEICRYFCDRFMTDWKEDSSRTPVRHFLGVYKS